MGTLCLLESFTEDLWARGDGCIMMVVFQHNPNSGIWIFSLDLKLVSTDRNYFQLRRRIDDLVYEFDRVQNVDERAGYQRRDQDLWIRWHAKFGWVAWDGISEEITGRPWYIQLADQKDYPPEGVWVSCKGEKSYVYDLVYPDSL